MNKDYNRNTDISGKGPDITFVEDQSPYYKERTRRNADESDMTVAIAVDWETAGEKCTKNCAQNSKTFSPVYKKDIPQNKYVPFRFPENGEEQANWAFAVEAAINTQGFAPKQDIRLNVAGNGIYTLSQHGISQEKTDAAVLTAVRYLQKTFNITEIRSGGQTGVDEAGIKAAVQLGIPAKVLAPKGWKFRTEAGKLKELHDGLLQHSREHALIGPIVDMEDFQKVTEPLEDPKDFYGAVISKLNYRERSGVGILSFEEINDWTDFKVQDHVLAYVGKELGLRTEYNYGYGGNKEPVNCVHVLSESRNPIPWMDTSLNS